MLQCIMSMINHMQYDQWFADFPSMGEVCYTNRAVVDSHNAAHCHV